MSDELWLSITFFALCGVGVIVAPLVPPRFNPLALSIVGSLAALNVLVLGALLLVACKRSCARRWLAQFQSK
jgi:hypothetical protein